MESELNVDILTQPDDVTCGPTCLHAVYRYLNDTIELEQVIAGVRHLDEGGTLAVLLACHALERGYSATIYTYNLHVFDPTWFLGDGIDIREKLRQQAGVKQSPKLRIATNAYIEFLERGGRIRFEDLTGSLIRRYMKRSIPLLTGLSATYLYRSAREAGSAKLEFDDVRGEPQGHFVVLCGYDRSQRLVRVADPWGPLHMAQSRCYWVSVDRLLNSILLGVLTYDANLLAIEPKGAG
jgi:hypothetical protein